MEGIVVQREPMATPISTWAAATRSRTGGDAGVARHGGSPDGPGRVNSAAGRSDEDGARRRRPKRAAPTTTSTTTTTTTTTFAPRTSSRVAKVVRTESQDVPSLESLSAMREGRQFTVASVGNNGKIYLRPTIRPANQRYPQPAFVFPVPNTAGAEPPSSTGEAAVDASQSYLLSSAAASPGDERSLSIVQRRPLVRGRSMSSSMGEHTLPVRGSDEGAFRIVIDHAGVGDPGPAIGMPGGIPSLGVTIPTWKIGTPRFSLRGTPFFRSSSYTSTNDPRATPINTPRGKADDRLSTNQAAASSHDDPPHDGPRASLRARSVPASPSRRRPATVARLSRTITPGMFDALNSKPGCDHPSVVRYGPQGTIKAATPARLVSEITSDTFVDYDLLADFFLTFRTFLDAADLLQMLLARFEWAVARGDNIGSIVRVRAFVALRHWILNYFADDFVVDWDLRSAFCTKVNALMAQLSGQRHAEKVPLRILDELKRCWRRVCGSFWDGPEFAADVNIELPLVPGGVAGSRDPKLGPSFWTPQPPQLHGIIEPDFVDTSTARLDGGNYFADVSKAGHASFASGGEHQVATHGPNPPLSPTSVLSEEVVSCSLPSRIKEQAEPSPFAAHPVSTASAYSNAHQIATTPRALQGKRVRPVHAHRRSGSFSDSTRDERNTQPLRKVVYKSTELLLALPYAGSLVRGNMFPPGQAVVEIGTAYSRPSSDAALAPHVLPTSTQKDASAMSGQGMKKLLGSVRRALGARPSTPAANAAATFAPGPRNAVAHATIHRVPGTAVVPSKQPHTAAPVRIDLLGAQIAEHFRKAVQEDAEEAAKSIDVGPLQETSAEVIPASYTPLQPAATIQSQPSLLAAPASEMTNGSKSILIMDDTLEPPSRMPSPLRQGLTPAPFALSDRIPTPPTTPPQPPFTTFPVLHTAATPDMSRSVEVPSGQESRPIEDGIVTDAVKPLQLPLARAPSMGHRFRPAHKSKGSGSLRRYASYHSTFTRHLHQQSGCSFDATTHSDYDVEDCASFLSMTSEAIDLDGPQPMLRRRPGGNLRAANNVGDLRTGSLYGHRRMSTGSMVAYTAYTESPRTSTIADGRVDEPRRDSSCLADHVAMSTCSLGALADKPRKPAGHLTTSKLNTRQASFEEDAQILAQIPDDDDDDGGVEAALLKLEGKFVQRRSGQSGQSAPAGPVRCNSSGPNPLDVSTLTLENTRRSEGQDVHDGAPLRSSRHRGLPLMASHDGDNDTPVISARASAELVRSRGRAWDWSQTSILRESSNEDAKLATVRNSPLSALTSSSPSRDGDLQPRGQHRAQPSQDSVVQSFLESDSDGNCSDLSSEISLDMDPDKKWIGGRSGGLALSVYPPMSPFVEIFSGHPLHQPPSPPITVQAFSPVSDSAKHPFDSPIIAAYPSTNFPLSPEATPPSTLKDRFSAEDGLPPPVVVPSPVKDQSDPQHLPFIMAFDSQILAQQFTLVEKDALNEIDWTDLIEMHWKDANTQSCSWVDYLRSSEPRGVEVVIARFNLMVKWVVSEIVLTESLAERARCISKYIHVADHCRTYRNFATMVQITIALTSADVTRLGETWAAVPLADKKILKVMEALVTPMSNFYNLRLEMEGHGAEQGCIPFVGIYTHDLLVNAERPSQIAGTLHGEPLVNFEKCRAMAAIVKNLLRLVEASQLYRFVPVEGITERCLWMAALNDKEITRRARVIEP